LISAAGCKRSAEEERIVPERDINAVMNDHAARLLEMDEVVMVAIGELKDKTPCIQVYVKFKSDALAEKIGTHLEGHPVDYLVSDEIRPLD
jgi:hypothetical protein